MFTSAMFTSASARSFSLSSSGSLPFDFAFFTGGVCDLLVDPVVDSELLDDALLLDNELEVDLKVLVS